MKRRTLLQWLASLAAWAQSTTFPGDHAVTLNALAEAVLPDELTPEGAHRVASRFITWVNDYRPGADTDHGYGVIRIQPKGPSPAPLYLRQLTALKAPMSSPNRAARRAAVESALNTANIKDLPRLPDGRHVIPDLMSFYFRSADASDLCYQRAIGRDQCRGLDGSDQAPPPLQGAA